MLPAVVAFAQTLEDVEFEQRFVVSAHELPLQGVKQLDDVGLVSGLIDLVDDGLKNVEEVCSDYFLNVVAASGDVGEVVSELVGPVSETGREPVGHIDLDFVGNGQTHDSRQQFQSDDPATGFQKVSFNAFLYLLDTDGREQTSKHGCVSALKHFTP